MKKTSLDTAREHLSRAEAAYTDAGGLFHLEEGLALLDGVAADGTDQERALAQNLATTYLGKICQSIGRTLGGDRAVPEPVLEHLFKVMLALDQTDFVQPATARDLKIEIARRLVNRYYEGHSAEAREAAMQQLLQIAKR